MARKSKEELIASGEWEQGDAKLGNANRWWSKFLAGLNGIFNPNHAWFDYGSEEFEGTFDSLIDKYMETGMTGREKELMDYQYSLNQQSLIDSQVNTVEGMNQAGLNPAMMYAGKGVSAPTVSQSQSGDSMLGMLELMMSIVRMPYEMKKLQAETANVNADTGLTEQKTQTEIQVTRINSINADYQDALNAKTIANLTVQYENIVADTNKKTADKDYVLTQKDAQEKMNQYIDERQRAEINQIKGNIDKMSADEKKAKAETAYQNWYNGFVNKNGFLPSSNDMLMLGTYIASLFGIAKGDVEGWLSNIVEEVGAFIKGESKSERGKGGSTSVTGGNVEGAPSAGGR